MEDKEKQLLLKDLCARVPYDTVVKVDWLGDAYLDSVSWFEEVALRDYNPITYSIENVQPYLRPMSSMTKEEEEKFRNSCNIIGFYKDGEFACTPDGYDWLNAHHFDYRNLIGAGLALEAPEGMYEIE